MAQLKTVFFVVLAVLAIASSILIASTHVAKERSSRPPKLLMEIGNSTVDGVLGSYCHNRNGLDCLTRMEPSQITTKAALSAEEVGKDNRISFTSLDGYDPSEVIVKITTTDGDVIQSNVTSPAPMNLTHGSYLVIADARWTGKNATYIYQIDVPEQPP